MQNLTQNKKLLILIAAILIIGIPLLIFAASAGKTPTTSPATNNPIDQSTANNPNIPDVISPTPLKLPLAFAQLTPGKASQTLVTRTLGNPSITKSAGDITVEYFKVGKTQRYHVIFLKKDIVQYIIEQKLQNNNLAQSYADTVKKPISGILYDLYKNGEGYDLTIYANDGIAFLANSDTQITAQIHYFIPTSYTNYLISSSTYFDNAFPPNQ